MGRDGQRPIARRGPDGDFLDDGDPGMSTMTSDMIRARPVTTAALAVALIGAASARRGIDARRKIHPSFRGPSGAREPGIHNPLLFQIISTGVMDSGQPLSRLPE
jgi:hypothetical protein